MYTRLYKYCFFVACFAVKGKSFHVLLFSSVVAGEGVLGNTPLPTHVPLEKEGKRERERERERESG